jgi:hypothetical protein
VSIPCIMVMLDFDEPPFWDLRRFAMLCGILGTGYFFAGKTGAAIAFVSWLVTLGEFCD